MKVFSVYDSKVEAYSPPLCAKAKGEALRQFSDLVNDGVSPISKHPADYTLFEIASFDELTGVITPHPTPISLGVAVEFKNVSV